MIYFNIMNWKDIRGYEGSYQISDTGLIKSVGRHIRKKMYGGKISTYYRPDKILSPGLLRGYQHVTLRKDNKSKLFKVHRLVLQTFNPCNNYEKLQVNHKDGNKSNNKLDNLEWCSHQDNQLHRYQELYNNSKLSKYSYITKNNGKWRLRGFQNKHIGYFETEQLAKQEYNRLIISNPELFKPTAYTKHDKPITKDNLF